MPARGNYHDLLRRADVDVLLVSLPILLNGPATHAALESGKYVICEKSAGANEAEDRAVAPLSCRQFNGWSKASPWLSSACSVGVVFL